MLSGVYAPSHFFRAHPVPLANSNDQLQSLSCIPAEHFWALSFPFHGSPEKHKSSQNQNGRGLPCDFLFKHLLCIGYYWVKRNREGREIWRGEESTSSPASPQMKLPLQVGQGASSQVLPCFNTRTQPQSNPVHFVHLKLRTLRTAQGIWKTRVKMSRTPLTLKDCLCGRQLAMSLVFFTPLFNFIPMST